MENRALSILSRDTVFRLSFPHIAPGMEVHVLGLGLNHQTAGAVLTQIQLGGEDEPDPFRLDVHGPGVVVGGQEQGAHPTREGAALSVQFQ